MATVLSTAFFPPLEWMALAAKGMTVQEGSSCTVIPSSVELEACESYRKQTWRNRCRFLSASGPEDFSYPVVRPASGRPITDIRVDYSVPWITRFERALTSAYESSPFFDYYKDPLFELLESCPETLFELNLKSIRFLIEKLHLGVEIRLTTSFVPSSPLSDSEDFREAIHPKKPNCILEGLGLGRPYWQVFSNRFGFQKGLSTLDLLFNEGPEASCYLFFNGTC